MKEAKFAFKTGSRSQGKAFATYLDFIRAVRAGQKAMVLGPGYVVLSDELYRKLISRPATLEAE